MTHGEKGVGVEHASSSYSDVGLSRAEGPALPRLTLPAPELPAPSNACISSSGMRSSLSSHDAKDRLDVLDTLRRAESRAPRPLPPNPPPTPPPTHPPPPISPSALERRSLKTAVPRPLEHVAKPLPLQRAPASLATPAAPAVTVPSAPVAKPGGSAEGLERKRG